MDKFCLEINVDIYYFKNATNLTDKSQKLFFWRTKENRGLEEQELKVKIDD